MHVGRMAPALAGILALLTLLPGSALGGDTSDQGKLRGEARTFSSAHLKGELVVLPGVFVPLEAEARVLPFMKANRRIFEGKTVMEIGAGCGVNSIYAAQLGATKVVATEISEEAIRNTRQNAGRFGVESLIETRLVPESDPSAYSVIEPGELFDVILSNPPYSLDLAAKKSDAVTDKGDLGLSIVRGLSEHLAPRGVAVLLYGSLFYHHVMVKFARLEGYQVRHHTPFKMTPWETETLFNHYLAGWTEGKGIDPGALSFDWHQDSGLEAVRVRAKAREAPLFPWNPPDQSFPGWVVIERP